MGVTLAEAMQRIADLTSERNELKSALKEARGRIDDILLKDRGKTREINVLVKENRGLRAELDKLKETAPGSAGEEGEG